MPKPKKSLPKLNISMKDFRKLFTLNIGTVMFGILFLYLLIIGVRYLTSSHIESYQVSSGPLSSNELYTGLVICEEEVVSADSSGYITYYAREGNKINANGIVFGLSTSQSSQGAQTLSSDDMARIKSQMSSFSNGFHPSNFNSTYSFKYELAGNILNYAGESSSSDDTDEEGTTSGSVLAAGQTLSRSPTDGIVLYSTDGYEDKTVEDLTAEDFDQNAYEKKDLKTGREVEAGDPVYTIITSETWDLLIPLSSKQAAQLMDTESIRVKFNSDGATQIGDFAIQEIDGNQYGRITFNKGLIRYASDRFLTIELVTNTQSGLKIPLSAITTKDFYIVPKEYAEVDENENYQGFTVLHTDSDGEESTFFLTPTVYASTDDYYYFEIGDGKENSSSDTLKEGDAIQSPDGSGRYVVGDTGVLEGVYCINQGYAVFRRIELIDQNDEYAIVRSNTSYGLSRYDHIAENADSVKESDIVY